MELSGIQPNPQIESVEEGIDLYRANGCDFILAVGGGSTLDACKAIAAGVKYDGLVTDLFVNESGLSPISGVAPLATILTMAGTGSEMDMGAVITVGEDHKKKVLLHPLLYPRFSILDPEYTFTVPEYHSMAGVADILCHLMEQYFTPDVGAKVQDRMNEGVMKAVLEDAPKILANPIARNVFDVRDTDDTKAAEEGVKKLEAFYSAIKMPARLREAGVREEDLDLISGKAVENGNLGILAPLGKDEVLQILRRAFSK